REFKGDIDIGLAGGRKVQGAPVDRDPPAADAEKTTEVDDRRADLAVRIDQNVDNPAHILIGRAAHFAPENAFDFVLVEDGNLRRCFRSCFWKRLWGCLGGWSGLLGGRRR